MKGLCLVWKKKPKQKPHLSLLAFFKIYLKMQHVEKPTNV